MTPTDAEQQTLTYAERSRLDQIARVKAMLVTIGVEKAASDLAAVVQAQKAARAKPRQPQRRLVPTGPKRRSGRIQGERPIYNEDVLARIMTDDDRRRPGAAAAARELRGGAGENPGYGYVELVKDVFGEDDEATLRDIQEKRCNGSRGRGIVYDNVAGITCHFCRQKKLCAEPECRRCHERDPSLPCAGKSECSRCGSARGRFCRQCLLVRYGWTLEEVRQQMEDGTFLCPHCYEADHPDEAWICNSSICMKKRGLAPTGIAIFEAHDRGFRSVGHYVQAQLLKARQASDEPAEPAAAEGNQAGDEPVAAAAESDSDVVLLGFARRRTTIANDRPAVNGRKQAAKHSQAEAGARVEAPEVSETSKRPRRSCTAY